MNRQTHNLAAFTLLELIIAMAMVVALAAALYSGMSTAINGKKAAERAIKPTRAASIASDLMARDFEGVVPPNLMNTTYLSNGSLNQNTGSLPYLAGSFYGQAGSGASDVTFFCVGSDGTPDVLLSEGIRQVELTLTTDDATPVLVRRVTRNVLPAAQAEPEDEIICRNVEAFTVRYYDGTSWYDEWDSDQMTDIMGNLGSIPMAVELTLTLKVEGVQQPGRDKDTYTVRRVIPIATALLTVQQ